MKLDNLETIHIDICGAFIPSPLRGYLYFITFINEFSSYGYIKLICENDDSLASFKEFKMKMELNMNKKLKIVRFDRGGKFYGRYDKT